MLRLHRIVVVALCLGLVSGCRRASDNVVATVGNSAITETDLQNRLQQTPAAYQHYATTQEGRRQFLEILIREKVLLEEARKAGLENDPAYHQAVKHFESDWKRQLEDYKESLLVDSYLKRLRVKELAVTDADVEHFYNDHASDYAHPVQLLAGHILLGSEADAQAVLDRIKHGESFEKLAKDVSKDPATALHGGRLSPFQRGTLPPEFEKAVFALHTGDVSGVVKTQFGFHIIKKIGEHALPSQSLEQARENIRKQLEREKFNEWVATRQASLGVHVNDQAMSRMPVAAPSQEPSSL